VAIGVLFGIAWLGEIVPAVIWNTVPDSIAEAGTPTNPVYVIDLSVILPLHVATGISLLRGRPFGLLLAPVGGMIAIGSMSGTVLMMLLRSVRRDW
jgi:hypothetical protein